MTTRQNPPQLAVAHIGTISHGTLRTEDLLETFTSELESLVFLSGDYLCLPENRQQRDRYANLTGEAQDCWSDDGDKIREEKEETALYLISELETALEDFAPPYCYFGTHEGDGSDFGFWPSHDQIEELPHVQGSDEAKELGEDCKFVNDHGNGRYGTSRTGLAFPMPARDNVPRRKGETKPLQNNNMTTQTDKPLSKKAQKQADQQEAIARLRSYLKPGDTVYTVLRHVSASGMSRRISLFIIGDDKQPFEISYWTSIALEYRRNNRDGGLVVGGCGMDMGFSLVYHLSRVLFPDGFKVEGRGRNGDTSGWDTDGGYALQHRWM